MTDSLSVYSADTLTHPASSQWFLMPCFCWRHAGDTRSGPPTTPQESQLSQYLICQLVVWSGRARMEYGKVLMTRQNMSAGLPPSSVGSGDIPSSIQQIQNGGAGRGVDVFIAVGPPLHPHGLSAKFARRREIGPFLPRRVSLSRPPDQFTFFLSLSPPGSGPWTDSVADRQVLPGLCCTRVTPRHSWKTKHHRPFEGKLC